MSGSSFSIEAKDFERLMDAAERFPGDAEKAIGDVLHEQAGPLAYRRINPLIHQSGRTFKGHRASAKASDWPRYDKNEPLAVTVATKGGYMYLYFPDDGSNTRRHAGRQRFFQRGGEAAAPEITQKLLDAVTNEWSN